MQRHIFDPNQPQGSMSLENMRNVFRALFQTDLCPLRPRASMLLDDFEYSTDALAQAAWTGTGLTITKSTTKQEGNYALQAVVDATGNRELNQNKSLNLSGFVSLTVWHRCDGTSQAFRFYLEDASGNRSYWSLTSHGTADTWKQDTITLASPSGNNGTNATLSTVAKFGFYQLTASMTFIFDTIIAACALTVAVEGALVGGFYAPVYVGSTHLSFAGGPSPDITPPSSNPRIDLLTIDSSGVLAWTQGTEASTPTEPAYPVGKIPICLVYCKTTMAKVVDYESAAANPNEAYIYRDVRPLYLLGMSAFTSLTDVPSSYAGQSLKGVRVNSGSTALEFFTLLSTFLELGDVPSSYTGAESKVVAVNSGATGLEFITKWSDFVITDHISILTGTVSNGGTIPLPSGYTEAQCKWSVSINTLGSYTGGDGDNLQGIVCSVDASRVVTCTAKQRDNGTVSGDANYIIIGIK